jgi:hypothetical protein
MSEQKPSVGRMVHYVSYGTPSGEYTRECRAATVTEVDEQDPNRVGLCVQNPTGLLFHPLAAGGSDHYEPPQGVKGYHGGTWHWPERV